MEDAVYSIKNVDITTKQKLVENEIDEIKERIKRSYHKKDGIFSALLLYSYRYLEDEFDHSASIASYYSVITFIIGIVFRDDSCYILSLEGLCRFVLFIIFACISFFFQSPNFHLVTNPHHLCLCCGLFAIYGLYCLQFL
eukprot:287370_1